MAETIDIKEVINSKSKKKAPKLFIWILKKILHLDRINLYLKESGELTGVDFVDYILQRMRVEAEVSGWENIDTNKKYIFVSNHPLGGLDGMSLIKIIGRKFDGKIRCIANDLLMYLPLKEISIPLNKMGSQERSITAKLNNALHTENQLLLFPAGSCSRFSFKNKIYDAEWKKAFIKLAVSNEREVVPIHFEGRNSIFFYTLSYIRTKLGIKANIEMLFLPHEMFGNSGRRFKVIIGKPISWQTFDDSKHIKQWAQEVKNTSYALKG
jgi:putative hemolysin